MRGICKALGWLLILIIAALSLVPPADRPVTGAPHDIEHFTIYVLTGIALGVGYRDRLIATVSAMIAYCAIIEAAQLLVPGRHARLSDFLVDSVASCAGTAAAAIAERWIRHRPAG